MLLRGRTIAVALISCAALAACSSGASGGGAGTDSPPPTSPAAGATKARLTPGAPGSAASPSAGSPAASAPKPPRPGDVSLTDLDTKNFTYDGGCGFEIPAAPVRLVNGRQADKTPGFDGRSSRAEWASSKEISLGGTQYLLVELTCTVGHDKIVGAHLIGNAGQRPSDLGIVAAGSKINISESHDQLGVHVDYRRITDKAAHPTGASSYKITMAGLTPVRLYSGDKPGDVGPAIAKLPAHGYDAGLVGVSGYVDSPSETSWVVGLLDERDRALTAESLGGGYGSGICWKPTVHTQAGETIGHQHLAYNSRHDGTGTSIDLATPSKAAVGVRGNVAFPIKKDTPGLLIPANGVVPALATATTGTAANGQGDALVITKAPADAYLDVDRFGAASGSEYRLPIGAFATPDGKIAMTGAWYNAPVKASSAAFGMRPIVNPADLGEKTC